MGNRIQQKPCLIKIQKWLQNSAQGFEKFLRTPLSILGQRRLLRQGGKRGRVLLI
jgi:hypothetical protein